MKHSWTKKGLILLSSLALVSCSNPFFGGDESKSIADITHAYDSQTGNTIVTITFTDEELDPVVFLIPKGVAGDEGNGIKEITAKESADHSEITLTISFTEEGKEDFVLSVPVLQGKGIAQVEVGEDESGNTTVQFTYTDGTIGDLITIPRGKDGTGIKSIEVSPANAFGVITITITLDDEDQTQTQFQVKNGAGVQSITVDTTNTDDTKYVLNILYTDGNSETVSFDKPRSNEWHVGVTAPENNLSLSNAHEGDFYLNKLSGNVYQLSVTGEWTYLFCMKADSTGGSGSEEANFYDVVFDANGGYAVKGEGTTSLWYFPVEEGKTVDLSLITFPIKDETEEFTYEFAGWFTDPTNVNAGQFTDLTVVTKHLKLYARYNEIAKG